MKELELSEEKFFDYLRMSREQFVEVLFMVKNDRSTSSYDKFAIFPEKITPSPERSLQTMNQRGGFQWLNLNFRGLLENLNGLESKLGSDRIVSF